MLNFSQIQNLDSLKKVIIDSIVGAQKQQFNSIDYINKVDSFYNNAWIKLTILFGLVGIFTPLIINYIQIKRNKTDKEIIKKTLQVELKEEIDKYLHNEVTKIQHASEGVSYHILSDIWFDKQKYKESFGETINAMTCYLIGNDYSNFINLLDDLHKRFKKVTKDEIESICTEYGEYYNINSLIKKMEETNDVKYSCHLPKLKTALFEKTNR